MMKFSQSVEAGVIYRHDRIEVVHDQDHRGSYVEVRGDLHGIVIEPHADNVVRIRVKSDA